MRSLLHGFVLLIVLSAFSFGQTKLSFTPEAQLYGMASIPTGDYGSKDAERAGFTKLGFGAGADFALVTEKNIAVVGSINYSTNPIDGPAVMKAGEYPAGYSMNEASYASTYLVGGARYMAPLSENLQPFVMAQVGMLISKFPGYTISNNVLSLVASNSTASAMAFSATAGVRLFHSFDLSLRYYSAEPEYETDISFTLFNGRITGAGKQPTSVFVIALGYVL